MEGAGGGFGGPRGGFAGRTRGEDCGERSPHKGGYGSECSEQYVYIYIYVYIHIYIYGCCTIPPLIFDRRHWGSILGPPASEGRPPPIELYMQLPSGPLLVPSPV